MKKIVSAVLFAAVTFASSNAAAFDKERKGFLIGLGGGYHSSTIDVTSPNDFDFVDYEYSENGPAFNFRVGGGVTNNLTLYFTNQYNTDSGTAYGLAGFGVTYYFRETTPSFYLMGGIGVGVIVFDDDDSDNRDNGTGEAIQFGVGLEPVRGLHLDLSIMSVRAEDDSFFFADDREYEIFSAQFMAGYTWF